MDNRAAYGKVLDIALSGESQLKHLASLTECNTFTFYEGADLTGLDLSDQDVTGLSFAKADFTRTNLSGLIYSPGAFNGAKID